jgi:integrase/recombinase XerD
MNLNDPVFQTQDPLSLGFLGKQWLKSMKLAGFKPQTLETHFKWIRLFLRWCEIRGLNLVSDVTRNQVEAYQHSLVRVPAGSVKPALKPITQGNRLSSVRLFFKWCAKKRILVYNPAADLEMPRVPKTLLRDVLTVAEVEQVLSACDLRFTMGIRNRAILETLYSTGIRRNELRYLKPKDIDFTEGTLTVREGKGGRDRLVPIGKRALAWISKYMEEVRSKAPLGHEPWLFLTRTGKSVSDLTPIVWKTMKKAGVNKEGSCHLFRHTMATMMLKNGADVRVVQEILGHAKIQTTQRYTHLCIDHLKLVHEKTHPARYPKEKAEDLKEEEEEETS